MSKVSTFTFDCRRVPPNLWTLLSRLREEEGLGSGDVRPPLPPSPQLNGREVRKKNTYTRTCTHTHNTHTQNPLPLGESPPGHLSDPIHLTRAPRTGRSDGSQIQRRRARDTGKGRTPSGRETNPCTYTVPDPPVNRKYCCLLLKVTAPS